MIVDTHTHIVATDEQRYPFHPSGYNQAWVKEMPVTGERLLRHMEEAGIDRAVLVQPASNYGDDNRYMADTVALYPKKFAGVCIVDLLAADAPDRLTYWTEERGTRGVRLNARTTDAQGNTGFLYGNTIGEWVDNPKTFPAWKRVQELGIPGTITLPMAYLPRLAQMLRRFPDNLVVLEHLALLNLQEGPPYGSLKALFGLAQYPNLRLKFSSVNLTPAEAFRPYVGDFFKRLTERFGTERLMWGSNFPNTYDRSYPELLALAQGVLSFLSATEQAQVFGGNALGVWPSLRGA